MLLTSFHSETRSSTKLKTLSQSLSKMTSNRSDSRINRVEVEQMSTAQDKKQSTLTLSSWFTSSCTHHLSLLSTSVTPSAFHSNPTNLFLRSLPASSQECLSQNKTWTGFTAHCPVIVLFAISSRSMSTCR